MKIVLTPNFTIAVSGYYRYLRLFPVSQVTAGISVYLLSVSQVTIGRSFLFDVNFSGSKVFI